MRYIEYLSKSLQIFIVCFILGNFINTKFEKYQKSLKSPNYILLAFAQLITIISITYSLQATQYLQQYFEEYTPNVLFSSFLLALQSNMIDNFKHVFYINGKIKIIQ